jgi:hypothetical protein
MKFKKYLKFEGFDGKVTEEYHGFVKSNMDGKNVEVFINPSKKEMKAAADHDDNTMKPYVRFIADYEHKKLYIWRANCNHHVIDTGLEIDSTANNSIWGVAEVKEGRMNFLSSDDAALSKTLPKFREKWKDDDEWTKSFFGKKLLTGKE